MITFFCRFCIQFYLALHINVSNYFSINFLFLLGTVKIGFQLHKGIYYFSWGHKVFRPICWGLYPLYWTLAQVLSCEFCKIFKNIFFYRTPLVATSVNSCSEISQNTSGRLLLFRFSRSKQMFIQITFLSKSKNL